MTQPYPTPVITWGGSSPDQNGGATTFPISAVTGSLNSTLGFTAPPASNPLDNTKEVQLPSGKWVLITYTPAGNVDTVSSPYDSPRGIGGGGTGIQETKMQLDWQREKYALDQQASEAKARAEAEQNAIENALKQGNLDLAQQHEAAYNYWQGIQANLEQQSQGVTARGQDINRQNILDQINQSKSDSEARYQVGMASAVTDAQRLAVENQKRIDDVAIADAIEQNKVALGQQSNQTGQYGAETSRGSALGQLAQNQNEFIAKEAATPHNLWGTYFMQRGAAPDWNAINAGVTPAQGTALIPYDPIKLAQDQFKTSAPAFNIQPAQATAGTVNPNTFTNPFITSQPTNTNPPANTIVSNSSPAQTWHNPVTGIQTVNPDTMNFTQLPNESSDAYRARIGTLIGNPGQGGNLTPQGYATNVAAMATGGVTDAKQFIAGDMPGAIDNGANNPEMVALHGPPDALNQVQASVTPLTNPMARADFGMGGMDTGMADEGGNEPPGPEETDINGQAGGDVGITKLGILQKIIEALFTPNSSGVDNAPKPSQFDRIGGQNIQDQMMNGIPKFSLGTGTITQPGMAVNPLPGAAAAQQAYGNSGYGNLWLGSSNNSYLNQFQNIPKSVQNLADFGVPISPNIAANVTGTIAPNLNLAQVIQSKGFGVLPSLQALGNATQGERENYAGLIEGPAQTPWADVLDFISKQSQHFGKAYQSKGS